jgi:hypothetical protein
MKQYVMADRNNGKIQNKERTGNFPESNDSPFNNQDAIFIKSHQWFTIAIMVISLCSIALINGYPTFFSDSGTYLLYSFNWGAPIIRPFIYGLFIRLTSLNISPWFTIIAQSIILAILIEIALNSFISCRLSWSTLLTKLFIIVLLIIMTPIAFYASQIMPDIFVGCVPLLLFMVTINDKKINPNQGMILIIISFIIFGSHFSYILIFAVLFFFEFIIRRTFITIIREKLYIIIGISFAVVAILFSNFLTYGMIAINPASHISLGVRLIAGGPGFKYLEKHCGSGELNPSICKFLDVKPLTDNELIYKSGRPIIETLGGMVNSRAYFSPIIIGTLKEYPFDVIKVGLIDWYKQLLTISPFPCSALSMDSSVYRQIERLFSEDLYKYEHSLQHKNLLSKLSHKADKVHRIIYYISIIVCLLLIVVIRALHKPEKIFLLYSVGAVLANALITGVLSQVQGRYQGRIAWIAFATILFLLIYRITRYHESQTE